MHHLFGPVPSRRLGRSLGIDLIPYKTCQLDCVYCECGATDRHFDQPQAFTDIQAVFEELRLWMAGNEPPDTITFSGSGEPLLEQGLPELAARIKTAWPTVRLALLTNGLLLTDPALRSRLAPLDLILPSLDAVSEPVFAAINNPMPGLTAKALVDALVALRREFAGEIWLEIFIVPGVNNTETELALFRETVSRIAPDRLQLNTLDRPGTDPTLTPAPPAVLRRVAEAIAWPDTEIIARCARPAEPQARFMEAEKRILLTTHRRPLSMEDLSTLTGLPEAALVTLVDSLVKNGQLLRQTGPQETLFVTAPRQPGHHPPGH